MVRSKEYDHVIAGQSAPAEVLAKNAGTQAVDSFAMCQQATAEAY